MKHIYLILIVIVLILLNLYLFRGIKQVFKKSKSKNLFSGLYWLWSIPAILLIVSVAYLPTEVFKGTSRGISVTFIFVDLIIKIIMLLFFAFDDFLKFLAKKFKTEPENELNESRKNFLKQAGLIAAVLPVGGFSFGIIRGAYNYQWFKHKLEIPGLPKAFHGLKIGQLSDIHSGSFYNKLAVQGGIDMFMEEKPDVIFFTGDIVNNRAGEVEEYFNIFKNVKAPLGVYSTLGNHDYGDYVSWRSREAKLKNLMGVVDAHKALGWRLLRNENHLIELNGDKLPIIGVENWSSSSRFPKYGDIEQAIKGVEDIPYKILLSHDPSHWEAKVLPEHKDIFLTLSGHTHGFQFGIETPFFRWSPAQYLYNQWAGVYVQDHQYINVNRGFGFLGYPGRIGIAPELSLIELVSV
jgi:hypothetical protein